MSYKELARFLTANIVEAGTVIFFEKCHLQHPSVILNSVNRLGSVIFRKNVIFGNCHVQQCHHLGNVIFSNLIMQEMSFSAIMSFLGLSCSAMSSFRNCHVQQCHHLGIAIFINNVILRNCCVQQCHHLENVTFSNDTKRQVTITKQRNICLYKSFSLLEKTFLQIYFYLARPFHTQHRPSFKKHTCISGILHTLRRIQTIL